MSDPIVTGQGLSVGRRCIQMSSSFMPDGRYFIIALCDDGTLWQLGGVYESKPEWKRLISPPTYDTY